jgi:hypothetical protein
MVVFVHSLGSLWQEKVLPAGGARVWNTTGIRDGPQVRSCAKVFGQVKLGAKARLELAQSCELTGAAWAATDLVEVNRCRKLALLCRASRLALAELYIVTVTEGLVGELDMDSWDGSRATLISFSRWRSRQEVMLAMQPFAWLRGSTGSAVLVVSGGKCDWMVTKW